MLRTTRLLLAPLLVTLLVGSVLATAAAPASAAPYFRYWAFFDVTGGKYVASTKGVGAAVPADGAVEAYRYAAPDQKKPNLPRIDPAKTGFAQVCGATKAVSGQKRVAVLIDYGVAADAEGQQTPAAKAGCAQVPAKATALQALQKVAQARTQNSSMGLLLCALDGYPAKGCASEKSAKATPPDSGFVAVQLPTSKSAKQQKATGSESGGGHTGLYAGLGAVVVLLGGGGFLLSRRTRSQG